jgi:NAD(P)-dependent dehydrogenase (short-subunit alcohol dehydrogenase family)
MTESHIRATTPALTESLLARVPTPRLGTPSDVAGVVAYLLSEDAGWVNGHIVSVNGGSSPRGG